MADILLHTLLFPPDATANAYIIGDIALELQKYGHSITVITTSPHYSILQDNLDIQPFTDGDKSWYKKSRFHGMECYHIVVPSEKGNIVQRLMTYINFHRFTLKLSKEKNIKADVVITQSPPLSIGIINGLLARRLKAKGVYVVQDLFPDGFITQGKIKNPLLIKILRILEKSVYKRNQVVVAISDGILGHLQNRVPSYNCIEMIPNFVDTAIYYPMPKQNALAERYQVTNKFVVSYVGNIGNAHDLSPILFCAEKLKHLNISFVIAGSGIKKEMYERQLKEQSLTNVQIIGYQKRENTPYINAFSDICLVMLAPHVKGFSFPSKVYTLMGMGKPIVVMCSKECNAAEFITDNRLGWAVESGDHAAFTELIHDLYEHSDKLKAIGQNSLDLLKTGYTKEHVGRLYDKLIKRLCV